MEKDPTVIWLEDEARGYYLGNLWATSPEVLWADISPPAPASQKDSRT